MDDQLGLAAAVAEIAKLARDTNPPDAQVIVAPELGRRFLLQNPDGTVLEKDLDFPPRAHALHTAHSFAAAIVEIAAIERIAGRPTCPTVWVGYDYVQAVLDSSTHRIDHLTWSLERTAFAAELANLDSKRPFFPPRDLVRYLRTRLAENIPGNLLPVLRKVNFQTSKTSENVVDHTRESLGLQLTAQVSGADALPETFSLRGQLIRGFEFEVVVECFLDVDYQAGKLGLIPVGDGVAEAWDLTLEAVKSFLRDSLESQGGTDAVCPILRGRP